MTIPARRAAKTEPIEALRDAAAETHSLSRRRGIAAAVLVALGLGGLFFGTGPAGIGMGALMLVIGTIIAGPFIATVSTRAFRILLKPFGLEGQLAVDNSARNPKRTATTANALLIGVFLVTFVTVAGTSLKDYAVAELQKLSSADLIVSSDGGSLDATLVKNLQTVPGVEKVTTFRRESVTIDGKPSQLSTADTGALLQVAKIKAKEGSLDNLQSGTIAVDSSLAGAAKIGSTVNVADRNGHTIPLKVVAILDATVDAAQVGNLTVPATFDSLVGQTAPTAAFVDARNGTESDTQKAIEDLTAQRPDITVAEGNAIGRLVGSVFDFLISAVNGLLFMSVIVALIGIVNTLSLSILERRRELGLLRVIGMTDKRVQRMVRLESGLIATLGTLTGLALGLIIGWGLIPAINRVSSAGIGFGFPGVQLVLVLVLGVALGFLASFLPARRSTHLEVLDAIASV